MNNRGRGHLRAKSRRKRRLRSETRLRAQAAPSPCITPDNSIWGYPTSSPGVPCGVPVLRRLLQLQRLGRGVARRRQLRPEPEPRRVLPERQQRRLEREREHRLPSP
nr:MAG TPA: hypothetical protein [Caudoviricetes sp.]